MHFGISLLEVISIDLGKDFGSFLHASFMKKFLAQFHK